MTIEYDLDVSDSFSMTFSNASKPGDTSMTFADLLKETSSATRTVSANWSNLTDYSRNKEKLTSMINAPLDRTLRAAQADMAAQAFIIDDTGILGRKYDAEVEYTFAFFNRYNSPKHKFISKLPELIHLNKVKRVHRHLKLWL